MKHLSDLDNMDVGEELQDPKELMEELRNLVFLSDYNNKEKEDMYDLFQETLPIQEIKEWRTKLIARHKGELTRVRNGELLRQDELKRAIKQAVNLDNT